MKFRRSLLTEEVIQLLRGVNDEISYSELAKRAKVTVPDLKRVLPSARRALLGEKQLFEPIVGYGLQRLNDSGKILRSEKNKKRLRSTSKRSLKELDTIHNYSELKPDEQITATLNRTLFELVQRDPDPAEKPKEVFKPEASFNIINIPKIK